MNEPLPVSDPVAKMEQMLRISNKSEGTISNYKSIGREFISIVGKKPTYSIDDLNQYLATIIQRKKMHGHLEDERKSGSYLRFVRYALAALYRANKWTWYATKEEERAAMPKKSRPFRPAYSWPEIQAILEAAKKHGNLRDFLILRIQILAFTRRRSQILLKRWDYNADQGTINFSTPVKGGKPQIIKLDQETNELMVKYLKGRTDHYPALFLSKRTRNDMGQLLPDHVNVILKRYCKMAGIQFRGTHAMRRGMISFYHNELGYDSREIFELTDHNSPSMIDTYIQIGQEFAQNTREKTHPFFIGEKSHPKDNP